jgi:hypothetical protein
MARFYELRSRLSDLSLQSFAASAKYSLATFDKRVATSSLRPARVERRYWQAPQGLRKLAWRPSRERDDSLGCTGISMRRPKPTWCDARQRFVELVRAV